MDSDQAIESFIEHLQSERRLSPHTQAAYQRDLGKLKQFCLKRQINTWSDLTHDMARLFAMSLNSAGLNGRSIQRCLSSARTFFNYLLREQSLHQYNPFVGVKAPKSQQKLPVTLDPDAIMQMLELPADSPILARDLAMIELFYSSGLRLAELVGLDLLDIDNTDDSIRVTGKGNKQRIVPVGRFARAAIDNWLNYRSELADSDEVALFVSNRGRRISHRSVQQRLALWAKKTGIGRNLHPHLLRHSFASHLLQSSGDLRAVQELLGHANLATTQVYTHLDFQQLSKVYDSAHPRAKKQHAG